MILPESNVVEAPTEQQSQIVTEATIDGLLARIQSELGVDTVAVLLLDDSQQFLVATAARGIDREVRQGVRVRAGRGFAGRIAAERRPVILNRITSDNVVNPLLLRRGIVSMLGVPLLSGRELLGVLHVGSLRERNYREAEIAAVERAAERVVELVIRHRAFVDQTAARALQSSLTPRLPDLPGLELAARYVPGSHYGVGGDWYDVFPLPSGLIGITIGDVMGHGLHAATMMGRVRSTLRSYALEYDCPARVLERVDRKIHHFEPGVICTVAYTVLNPANGELLVSSAGHLPPALTPQGSAASLLSVHVDLPIGVVPQTERRFTVEALPEGALLCMYTDGLVERRASNIDDELARLCQTLSGSAVTSADAACAEVMDAMLGDREPDDDVSVLVVSRTPSG